MGDNVVLKNKFTKLTSSALFVLSVASCSSAGTATTTTISPSEVALPYFEQLANDSRVGYDAAAGMSVGVAREYALYQKEYLEAIEFAKTEGQNFDDPTLETARIDESGRILLESAENRITYSNFDISIGKLIDFEVEGRPLSKNLKYNLPVGTCYTGDSCNSEKSFDLRLLHAYVNAEGNLVITYEFRIGSKASSGSVRADRAKGGLPSHVLVASTGEKIKAIYAVETFARGETRVNAVAFGPLQSGGNFSAVFNFRWNGYLYEYKVDLGSFVG